MSFESDAKEQMSKMWEIPCKDIQVIHMRSRAPEMLYLKGGKGQKAFLTSAQ